MFIVIRIVCINAVYPYIRHKPRLRLTANDTGDGPRGQRIPPFPKSQPEFCVVWSQKRRAFPVGYLVRGRAYTDPHPSPWEWFQICADTCSATA
jgi:hypothetical protein